MKVLLIEDEMIAANRLKKLLAELDLEIEIVSIIDTIEGAVSFLNQSNEFDLIFMDIHLADGSSFEIFKSVEIKKPLIFTTAYDEYAINAFKVNALDYLLKPIKKEELKIAYEKAKNALTSQSINFEELIRTIQNKESNKRFLIRFGQQMKIVEIKDAAYFYTQDKVTFIITKGGKRYPLDISLEKLDKMVNPTIFFRINRQLIININAISEMLSYSKSRVKLILNPPCEFETIVSTERSPKFKKWLLGEI